MSITSEEYKELLNKKKTKNKHNAKGCRIDNIYFPSLLEGKCYSRLKDLKKEGIFSFFLRQIPFDLPGQASHRIDFCVFFKGRVLFIEAKGRDLPLGKLKRRQVEELYEIHVHVVKTIGELNEVVKK